MTDDRPLMRDVVFPEPAPAFIMKLRGGTFPRQIRRSMSAWVSGLFARLLILASNRDIFGDENGIGQHGLKFDPYFVLQPDKPITDVGRYMPRILIFSEDAKREFRFIE